MHEAAFFAEQDARAKKGFNSRRLHQIQKWPHRGHFFIWRLRWELNPVIALLECLRTVSWIKKMRSIFPANARYTDVTGSFFRVPGRRKAKKGEIPAPFRQFNNSYNETCNN